jgi:hypothetical protein
MTETASIVLERTRMSEIKKQNIGQVRIWTIWFLIGPIRSEIVRICVFSCPRGKESCVLCNYYTLYFGKFGDHDPVIHSGIR